MKRIKVLITDAIDKKALAALRSLGRRGLHVDVSGSDIFAQSFYSKYLHRRILYPNPRKNIEEFLRFMLSIVKVEDYDVLLPMDLWTIMPLSRHKALFNPFVGIPIADYHVLIQAHDKYQALKKAEECGVPIPKTYLPKNTEQLKEILPELDYPVVIKLRKGSASIGLRFASSSRELLSNYITSAQSNMVFDFNLPMIQEYIPGEIHDVCVLFNEGKCKAALTQKRIKMLPITGGVGIVNQTTNEPELREMAINLLKKMEWHGPAQVEFKMDSRDKTPKLMEVNSKFWGTLDLSIQAGIDFPFLACKMVLDGDINPVYEYKVGLKYRWIVPYELRYVMKSRKWKSVCEFLNFQGNIKYDIWLRDPLPSAVKIIELIGLYSRKLIPRLLKTTTDKVFG